MSDDTELAKQELRQAWDHADSPLRAEFYALLGRAYGARGEEERARSTWEYAALEIDDPSGFALDCRRCWSNSVFRRLYTARWMTVFFPKPPEATFAGKAMTIRPSTDWFHPRFWRLKQKPG